MTTDDLIEKLKEMRAAARRGDNMTAMTQLFGIIFDKDIENSGLSAVAIGSTTAPAPSSLCRCFRFQRCRLGNRRRAVVSPPWGKNCTLKSAAVQSLCE